MTLDVVTTSNYETVCYSNIYTILSSNTSKLGVTSTYSLNTKIPVVVIQEEYTDTKLNTGDNVVNCVVELTVMGKTITDVANYSSEIRSLMDSSKGDLHNANMDFKHQTVSMILPLERGDQRVHFRRLMYTYVIK